MEKARAPNAPFLMVGLSWVFGFWVFQDYATPGQVQGQLPKNGAGLTR
jgi:hypothetical protein